MKISEVDNLFKSYNYQVSTKSNNKIRIYTLRYGMYHAAELLLIDSKFDYKKIKQEYSELGYATKVQLLENIENLDEYLFEGFFIKTPLGNELKNRYKRFVKKQIQNLPEGSEYKYINVNYNLLYQDKTGAIVEHKDYYADRSTPIINKINELISDKSDAVFIIIEAAAGFGKTCTANEVLNLLSTIESKQLPFFTELSRNREARIFKHILLNEIDQQFPSGIKQNIVIEQIIKGRIPLIIDGFDELITKDSKKEDVESMLTTIVELLKGNSKIIITTRKTAVFKSDEFFKIIQESNNEFSIARFEIYEPDIESWLSKNKIELIKEKKFPIEQIANPVLLSYLRNIPFSKLQEYLQDSTKDKTLIDKYIDYLLKREKERQNIKLSIEEQKEIFRRLVLFMTEYNVTSETKELIKDFIREYNQLLLINSLEDYLPDERPSLDDLVETISNHVFLDRKPNGDIGFVNDFIFGLLIGENVIYNKYKKEFDNYPSILPQDFAIRAIQSFIVENIQKKELLWNEFSNNSFNYDVNFYFDLDFHYKKIFNRKYENLHISNREFKNINFNNINSKFLSSSFNKINFINCKFNIDIFYSTYFINCEFYDCDFSITEKKEFNDFAIYACSDNNGFIEKINKIFNNEVSSGSSDERKELTIIMILENFFGVNNIKPRPRKLSLIKEFFSDYSSKEVGRKISYLKSEGYIFFQDDIGFISKKGIAYFNQHKSEL